jgi:hypothetical protein
MPEEKKLNYDDLKEKTELTADEEALVQQEALKELEAEEKGTTPDEDSEDEEPKEESKPKEKDNEEESDEEIEEPDEKPEEESDEEEEEKGKKKEEDEEPDEDEDSEEDDKKSEKQLEEEAREYAFENNVNFEEAKEALKSEAKILKKYDSDPKSMARTIRSLQQLNSKQDEAIKSLEAKAASPIKGPNVTADEMMQAIEKGAIKKGSDTLTKEGVVEAYRKENPDTTEMVDSDTVFRMATKDMAKEINAVNAQRAEEIKSQAKNKKESYISNLPESVKHLKGDLKKVLDEYSDVQIMSEGFNFQDLVAWARGLPKNYKAALKKAKEDGIKLAKEQPEIVAEIPSGSPGKGGKKPKKSSTPRITEEEKQRAFQMFDGAPMNDKEKIEAYLDIKKHDEELDKNKEKV